MTRKSRHRRAAAVVELAILLPILVFLFVIAVDWARIFYCSIIVTNCARNGALYSCDAANQASSPYSGVTQAALSDAPNLSPAPTVSSTSGQDSNGSYVEVTVSYSFKTVTNFPGTPSDTDLVRKVRMNVAPTIPN